MLMETAIEAATGMTTAIVITVEIGMTAVTTVEEIVTAIKNVITVVTADEGELAVRAMNRTTTTQIQIDLINHQDLDASSVIPVENKGML
jgi:uncharacterized protein with PIN domain